MKCIICGANLPEGAAFCPSCGSSQKPQQSQQPQPQQTQQQLQKGQLQQAGQPQQPQPQIQQPQSQPLTQPQPQAWSQQQTQQTQQQRHQQQWQPQQRPQPQRMPQQTPPKTGGNKGLIIGGIIAGSILLLAGLILIGSMMIKRQVQKTLKNAQPATEAVTEAATEMAEADEVEEIVTTEATTEATTEEPKPPVFAEEKGLVFSGLGVETTQIPYGLFYDKETYNNGDYTPTELDTAYVKNATVTCRIENVLVTEPDEEGYVTYIIEECFDDVRDCIDTGSERSWLQGDGYWGIDYFDYYTGETYKKGSYFKGIPGDEYISRSEINYNNDTVIVSHARVYDYENIETQGKETTDEGDLYHFQTKYRDINYVKVPKDYDGVVLALYEGEVDPERYKIVDEADRNGEDTYSDANGGLQVMFEEDKYGYTDDPSEFKFLRISEVAKPADADSISDILSYDDDPELANFDWAEKALEGDISLGGKQLTDPEAITGKWQGYLLWDKDNKMDNYGQELLKVKLSYKKEKMKWTFNYYQVKWGEDGEWTSKEDDEKVSFKGDFKDGVLTFDPEEAGCVLEIKGFYTDGYVQYAVGTMMAQSGETADVFLFRP